MDSRTASRRPQTPPSREHAAVAPRAGRPGDSASPAASPATAAASSAPSPAAAPGGLEDLSPFALNFLAVARGIALFLGVFTLFNVFGEWRSAAVDADFWWIDLRPCPVKAAQAVMAIAGLQMALFAVRPAFPPPLRLVAIVTLAILLGFASYSTAVHYSLLRRGVLHATARIPFSVHAAGCLSIVLIGLRLKPPATTSSRHAMLSATTTVLCLVGFPLAQMYCFGQTDHRRAADAIVVFGCKVNSNDRPSWALYDRVKTASALYHEGLAETLIVSGGPGEGRRHETDVMKELAMEAGVPESAILVDRDGVDTAATARNTVPLFRQRRFQKVLAVSHFYHLPRIQLSYERMGFDVLTVPARQTHPLKLLPYHLAREVAALWVYYFRPHRR